MVEFTQLKDGQPEPADWPVVVLPARPQGPGFTIFIAGSVDRGCWRSVPQLWLRGQPMHAEQRIDDQDWWLSLSKMLELQRDFISGASELDREAAAVARRNAATRLSLRARGVLIGLPFKSVPPGGLAVAELKPEQPLELYGCPPLKIASWSRPYFAIEDIRIGPDTVFCVGPIAVIGESCSFVPTSGHPVPAEAFVEQSLVPMSWFIGPEKPLTIFARNISVHDAEFGGWVTGRTWETPACG